MDVGKVIDATEAVAVEDVAAVKEDVVAIRIAPTTPRTVFTYKIFLGISEVSIGMIFGETVNHMLAVNSDVQRLVADAVTTAHAGGVVVAKDKYLRN